MDNFTIPNNISYFILTCCVAPTSDSRIGMTVLFTVIGLIGCAANMTLLHLLHRQGLLHQPTYFLLSLTCLGDLLICGAVIPLFVATVYLEQSREINCSAVVAASPIMALIIGTALFWIVFLLLIMTGYRLRIVGRECVDETRLRTCTAWGLVALLLAFLTALQHLFTNEGVTADFHNWTFRSAYVSDLVVFLLCGVLIGGCCLSICRRSHRGHLRKVQHGRLFQNEFAQMKEWCLNRSLMVMTAIHYLLFAPWFFWSVFPQSHPKHLLFGGTVDGKEGSNCSGEVWADSATQLILCASTLFPLGLLFHRKDVRTELVGCVGSFWRPRKLEELPSSDRSTANIRCISFRNDFSEFV
ncbi:hypothetical protein BV898_04741 [Hypsibius exemplaris]|uniref:G-protein coupled receptors family 1 profile domain-containing protein n=1 Tax=Hypsibius exemplaris TaxID=2072580 RepID=A0A1W0X1B3_HYPEX|nr:hypothetical protein BV898_04741 [Hypsibius exemplaris]